MATSPIPWTRARAARRAGRARACRRVKPSRARRRGDAPFAHARSEYHLPKTIGSLMRHVQATHCALREKLRLPPASLGARQLHEVFKFDNADPAPQRCRPQQVTTRQSLQESGAAPRAARGGRFPRIVAFVASAVRIRRERRRRIGEAGARTRGHAWTAFPSARSPSSSPCCPAQTRRQPENGATCTRSTARPAC